MEGGEGVQNECIDWANADVRLDPEGDDLPQDRLQELRLASMRASQGNVRCSNRLHGKQEDRHIEAAELREHAELSRERTAPTHMSEDLTLLESMGQSPATRTHFQQQDSFMEAVRTGYKDNPVLAKVAEKPKHHPTFSMDSGLIHTMNSGGERVLCVPQT